MTTAYLINPFDCTITEVQYTGNYKNIYEHIQCDCFDVARINEHGDGLFVDDEGLYREDQRFFAHADYPQPLAGLALCLGSNEEGESVAPHITLEELRSKIEWVMPISVMGDIVWMNDKGECKVYE